MLRNGGIAYFCLLQLLLEKDMIMRIYIVSVMVVALLAAMFYHLFKIAAKPDEDKDRSAPLLLASAAIALCADALTGSKPVLLLMVDLIPSLTGMLLLTSSLWEVRKPVVTVCASLPLILSSLYIVLAARGGVSANGSYITAVLPAAVMPSALMLVIGLCRRLRSVKAIVRAGTVWTYLCLAVDALYVIFLLLLTMGFQLVSHLSSDPYCRTLYIFPLLTGLMLTALGLRKADDVVFVLWRRQERRIVESMKVTKVETAVDPVGIDDVYQEIYERVVAYFEQEKPFLDNALTINDLVRALYSNKLYISRAISQFTGRNFCQFVNYHRVVYSMELFRNNPEMKIHELASGCGFNSDVSYNMAFRLFMGETPGEWCRKERNRKFRVKK